MPIQDLVNAVSYLLLLESINITESENSSRLN